MARRADYGLMVWDGASPGTCLNMLRLAAAGSPCVVYDTMRSATFTLRNLPDWHEMLRNAGRDLVGRIEARMTDIIFNGGTTLDNQTITVSAGDRLIFGPATDAVISASNTIAGAGTFISEGSLAGASPCRAISFCRDRLRWRMD